MDNLRVTGITPADATVTVQCRGRGCPFASRSVRPRSGTAILTSLFARRRLRSGANVAVLVVAPGTTGRYLSFETKPSAVPTLKAGCSAPGSISPVGCPGPAGADGAAGPQGAAGAPGPRGSDGAPGARGPSDAFTAGGQARTLPATPNTVVTVAALENLPAGAYLLSSVAQAGDFDSVGSVVQCNIRVNGQQLAGTSAVVGNGAGSARAAVLSASGAIAPTAAFRATLECQSSEPNMSPSISNQRLTALRIGTLNTQ